MTGATTSSNLGFSISLKNTLSWDRGKYQSTDLSISRQPALPQEPKPLRYKLVSFGSSEPDYNHWQDMRCPKRSGLQNSSPTSKTWRRKHKQPITVFVFCMKYLIAAAALTCGYVFEEANVSYSLTHIFRVYTSTVAAVGRSEAT